VSDDAARMADCSMPVERRQRHIMFDVTALAANPTASVNHGNVLLMTWANF